MADWILPEIWLEDFFAHPPQANVWAEKLTTKSAICIGILNHLFFWPEQYRRTGGMSIVFLFDENPDVASAGSGGAAVGGARSVPDHAARSNSKRVAPARVGNRFSAPQIVWNKSNRCAGERGGARLL
jgi:hypothetical protein